MKKIFIVIGGIFILGVGGYLFINQSTPNEYASIDTMGNPENIPSFESEVRKQDFKSSVQLEGTTKIKNEQKLRFNTSGRVSEVYVETGKTIKKGQKLAKIDASETYAEIEKAQLDVENAKNDVDTFVKNINTKEIKRINLNIDSEKLEIEKKEYEIGYLKTKQKQTFDEAKLSLQEAKNNLELQKEEAKKSVAIQGYTSSDRKKILEEKKLEIETKTKEYNDFQEKFDANLTKKIAEYNSSLEEYYRNIDGDIQDIEKQFNEIGKLVGVGQNKRDKPDYILYFSGKNSLHVGEIRGSLYKACTKLEKLKKAFRNIKDNQNKAEIIIALEKEKLLYEQYYIVAKNVVLGYKDSINSTDFNPETYENTYRSTVSSINTKITTLSTTINTLRTTDTISSIKTDLENERKDKKLALEDLKIAFQKTKDEQKYLVDSSSNTIKGIQIKLELSNQAIKRQKLELEKLQENQIKELAQAKIDLKKQKLSFQNLLADREKLLNLSNNTEYKLKKNAVKQAQVSLKDAKKKLENYILTAPFDGKVTKIDMNVGDRLNADSEKYISISDPNSIEINTFINQSDITKIKKGMKAEITMKSYPNKVFLGTVFEVETTPKEENGVTKFAAKIVLEKPKDVDIYSGLKAKVKIIASNLENALVVPFTSVETVKNGKKYVTVMKNGKKEKREVETGFTDGKLYEIKSGLKEGEIILELDYVSVSENMKKPGKDDTDMKVIEEGLGEGDYGSF